MSALRVGLFLAGCAVAGLVLPSGAALALAGLVAVAGACWALWVDSHRCPECDGWSPTAGRCCAGCAAKAVRDSERSFGRGWAA